MKPFRSVHVQTASVRAAGRSSRRGFSLLPLIIGTALIGILIVLAANTVLDALQLRREYAIRENLQTVWVAANQYFIVTKTEEVSLKELRNAKGDVVNIGSLKPVASEDYLQVNGGVIRRDADKLFIEYPNGKKTVRVTYKTPR